MQTSPIVVHDQIKEMIIIIHNGSRHYVDLRSNELSDGYDVLDKIMQIQEKSWCTPKLLFEFISVLKDATVARFGADLRGLRGKKLDWREGKITNAI